MMVGNDVALLHADKNIKAGPVRLSVHGLNVSGVGAFGVPLKNINLEVRGGELVAIAGVAGNGQSEFFDAVSGEHLSQNDAIMIDGVACGAEGVTARRKRGAAFVPEERLGHGAVPRFRLSENVTLTRHGQIQVIDRPGALGVAAQVIKAFDVRKGKVDPEAQSLSGGNLQKFVVGRELDRNPKVLVVNQPTWGVDAGAAATIRQALIDLARSGAAVLVISQDLDEIFEIADRIAVISRGQLSAAVPARELSMEKIGLLMAGAGEVLHAAHS
jgi:general nucleoside transport system ATP-binding protein